MTQTPIPLLNAGESSRRPTPNRTLPQPSRLTVAHRDSTGQLDHVGELSDAESLRRDLHRRAELSRKADKWGDKMMEEVIDRRAFKRAVSALSSPCFSSLLSLCLSLSLIYCYPALLPLESSYLSTNFQTFHCIRLTIPSYITSTHSNTKK